MMARSLEGTNSKARPVCLHLKCGSAHAYA